MLFLYKVLKFIFRHVLPEEMRYPLARFSGRVVCLFNASRRTVIVGNLTPLVGSQEARRMAPVLLGNFLMTAVDFFCPKRNLAREMVVENGALLDKAYRRHKKVILVSAHLGHWELGMSYLVEKGYSVAGVYAPYREDDIVRWIMGHRNTEVEWIPAVRGAAEACVNALERGRLLGMVADIPFGERGHRVRINGSWARLPLGPWAIAVRARAAVIPGFVLRERPGHYRGILHEPILPPEGTFRRQIETMQDAYRKLLEFYIQKYPEQWGVLQPFWEPAHA